MMKPDASCDVDGVTITVELDRRPSRAPDYEAEARALTSLGEAMSTSPGDVLQSLVEIAMRLTHAESAGISLLTPDETQDSFQWVAIAGAWSPYRHGSMPRETSPCGYVIAQDAVLLLKDPHRAFPALLEAQPAIGEGLLAPFHIGGKPVGTVWVVKHDPAGRFEREDARLLLSLARFASAAHQMVLALRSVQAENLAERSHVEAILRDSAARQAFLLTLSDALRPLADPVAVQDEAMRTVGEHLKVSRAFYSEVSADGDVFTPGRSYHDGVAPMPARLKLSDFGVFMSSDLAGGRNVVVADTHADDRFAADPAFDAIALRAGIGVPLVRDGRLLAIVSVHQSTPRTWTAQEIALVEEVAERSWAAVERVRAEQAMRDSEERFRTVTETIDDVFYMTDLDREALLYLSPSFERVWGQSPDALMHDISSFTDSIHPDDRPIVAAAQVVQHHGKPVAAEYRIVRPDGTVRWILDRCFPVRTAGARRSAGIASDITARKETEAALLDSEARFRQFRDASTSILWIRDAATMRMEFASPAFEKIYGIAGPGHGGDPALRAWVSLIVPEDRKTVLDGVRRVRAGERIEMQFRVRRASDGALRWIHNTDFPLRDAAGRVRWIAGLGSDITDAKEAEERQGVLVSELQHRTRNLIAVVRSLSDRTLGNAASLEDFGRRFRLRLSALSRVQGLLSHLVAGARVTFGELLMTELAAHGATDGMANKVTLDGPADVPLRSGMVQTLALALHELATNAGKYGAFAAPNGHLFVRWQVEPPIGNDPPHLHVEWRETGVDMPAIGAPARGGGYGRELIERALPYQLKAKTSYELGADGVRCVIVVPISRGGSVGGPDIA